jgi:uncharacterized protein YprB with RNaseH-like and TPR domain
MSSVQYHSKVKNMLTNTFLHIQGIGAVTEQRLWEGGIQDWDAFLCDSSYPMPPARRHFMIDKIKASKTHLKNGNPTYFSKILPSNDAWRYFAEFRSSAAYLDIETYGLDAFSPSITTIALYDGREVKTYIDGRNLDDFLDDIMHYKVIITYNGKCFDVPFIERQFHIRLDQAHIDLRYVLASLGFKGGLKGIERQLGIDRGFLRGVDGFGAVLLWDEFQKTGKPEALETLLAYNVEDTINLETLMVMAYNLKLKETPFMQSHHIPEPVPPYNPYNPDLRTIDFLKSTQ